MSTEIEINGRIFHKSSYSPSFPFAKCVGVSVSDKDILITNLSEENSSIIKFSAEEWDAFIRGAKAGEFDPV